MVPNRSLQDQRFTLNIDAHFRASLKIEPFPHRFGMAICPFEEIVALVIRLHLPSKMDSHPRKFDILTTITPAQLRQAGTLKGEISTLAFF